MKSRSNPTYKGVAAFLSLIMTLSLMPFQAGAEVKSKVQIQIGKPSVWSLAQAHYLLAKMHKDNRNLSTRMPTEKELDPNAINTTRIQLLRTLLDVEGQFSEKVGAENQSKQREEQFALRQREEAREELIEKEAELDRVNSDLRKLKRTRARKKADFDQREAARLAQADNTVDPPVKAPLPDQAQKDLDTEIKELDVRIANKEAEKDDLEAEIGIAQAQTAAPAAGSGTSQAAAPATNSNSLRARANASVAGPTLSEVTLGNSAALPDFNTSLSSIITSAMRDTGKPSLAASIALDNFVGMQYEIIAKRLTLLRDEVGPDERVIFLELPSSIYTVPCKGDEYIAQVQWKVNWYYDDKQAEASMADENRESHTNIEDLLNNKPELKKRLSDLESRLANLRENKNGRKVDKSILREEMLSGDEAMLSQQIKSVRRELSRMDQMVDEEKWKPAFTSNVRALDVIPRQSALNVNDIQATVSQKNFMGVLKMLFGLGIRVNYQRQRELYEQYLQQEVFASGFGKGSNAFGWTFGALPGTNRVAPGVRTTYAVLAVPREASALRVEATGVSYHRKSAPDYDLDERRYDPNSKQILDRQQFVVRIPNEHTEQFKVMSVAYSPVSAGEAVTVVVKGDYFSPQIGVLVDGVALNRSLSVGNTEISDAGLDNTAATGVRGQYELVSSHEIVMKFSMVNDKYVGTPNITLVTPEKTTAINYLPLQINYHYPRMSLRSLATTEPMFIEAFGLTKGFDPSESGKFLKARLTGQGFRRNASIFVNDRQIPIFKDRKWKLIKEATDEYLNISDDRVIENILYELLKDLPDPGVGHVDQMIAEELIKKYGPLIDRAIANYKARVAKRPDDKSDAKDSWDALPFAEKGLLEPERALREREDKQRTGYDKDDKRAVFLLFLNHAISEQPVPPVDYHYNTGQQNAQQAGTKSQEYMTALKDRSLWLYQKNPEIQEILVHEVLIRYYAQRYASRICLKNGVRGTECTEASRRKVVQRRLEELISDNVDPFNQDEPYHNEELYQQLKEDLLRDSIPLRRLLVRKAIEDKKSKGESDEAARAKLVKSLYDAYVSAHKDDCKKVTPASAKDDCEKDLKKKNEKKEEDLKNDYESLYQEVKRSNPDDHKKLLQAIKRKRASSTGSDGNSSGYVKGKDDKEWDDKLNELLEMPVPGGFDEVTARQDALKEIENLYENPRDDEEYALQESTKAYSLRFLGNGAKSFSIRYRQKTSNGFNSDEFSKKGDDSAYKIVRYTPDVIGDKALVDVRFLVAKDKDTTIEVTNSEDAEKVGPIIQEKPGSIRASFLVKYQQRGKGRLAEREHFWVTVTSQDKKPADAQPNAPTPRPAYQQRRNSRRGRGVYRMPAPEQQADTTQAAGKPAKEEKNIDIELPISARVTRIANSRTGKPEGYASEQPMITIYGYNLQTIAKVLFGDKESTIIGSPDYNSLVLKVPKADPVAKGEAVEVPVVLVRTDGTQVASPIFYTYLGPPSPVVVYRPRRPRQVRRPYAAEDDENSYVDPEPDQYNDAETRPRIVGRRRN